MSFRRLWVLVDGLPRDSAVARAQYGGAAEWSATSHLVAELINEVRQIAAGKKLPADQLVRPPGTKQEPRKVGGAAELDALFTGGG